MYVPGSLCFASARIALPYSTNIAPRIARVFASDGSSGWVRSRAAASFRSPSQPRGRPTGRSRRPPPTGAAASKDQRPVRAVPVHSDDLVDVDRGGVLGAHEEADDRNAFEQQPDQVAERTLR